MDWYVAGLAAPYDPEDIGSWSARGSLAWGRWENRILEWGMVPSTVGVGVKGMMDRILPPRSDLDAVLLYSST